MSFKRDTLEFFNFNKTLAPPKAGVEQLIAQLKAEPVNTWFDLGLFIDRVRENRKVPAVEYVLVFYPAHKFMCGV